MGPVVRPKRKSSQRLRSPSPSRPAQAAAMLRALHLLPLAALAVTTQGFLFEPGPLHASCRIDWQFGKTCVQVHDWIVNQLKAWDNDNCRGVGFKSAELRLKLNEKCRYKLTQDEPMEIRATHTPPVKRRRQLQRARLLHLGDVVRHLRRRHQLLQP